ncbi:hypothetical protein [Aquimarina muelleri]|uniref:DUF4369 domain-containing protein n=1 Tax=Aquimarina muelleri TaxID=279356 RepID=A0A918JYB4_9FLAO|nr:hypothetical protein [Aquimarina muelleri]MCX2762918.1 hypothetical protein [Aquimarina muelleri]GGX27244.1 hypothetical protein GCM10007384_30710 [Aquimarina muelleri]
MYRLNIYNTKKLFLIPVVLCFFVQLQAQNDQISIDRVNDKEFTVSTVNGIPFTVVLEKSNNDGQYHLASNGNLTFKLEDMIDTRSTLRIVFEEEMYHSLENKLLEQYRSDVDWIKSVLDIEEGEFEIFPSRPVFTDQGLEKLKGKVFEYTTTDKKENDFNKWIEKINYSVGAGRFFNDLYAASNGENNGQRHNFLPINIYEALQNR